MVVKVSRYVREPQDGIVAEMLRIDMSVSEFARRMGMPLTTAWRVLRGQRGAPGDWFDRASVVLGVPAYQLRGDSLCDKEHLAHTTK